MELKQSDGFHFTRALDTLYKSTTPFSTSGNTVSRYTRSQGIAERVLISFFNQSNILVPGGTV
jgi:hypothetical protein